MLWYPGHCQLEPNASLLARVEHATLNFGTPINWPLPLQITPMYLRTKTRRGIRAGSLAAKRPVFSSKWDQRVEMTSDQRYEAFRGAQVAITGGLGFIGSSLARRLSSLGSNVLVIDNRLTGSGANFFNLHSLKKCLTVVEARSAKRIC